MNNPYEGFSPSGLSGFHGFPPAGGTLGDYLNQGMSQFPQFNHAPRGPQPGFVPGGFVDKLNDARNTVMGQHPFTPDFSKPFFGA